MGAKEFFKPISWSWRCWPCSLALLVLVFIFDYALSSFSGLNANKELAEKLLYQDVAIKLRLGEIRSINGLGKLAYQGVPGKEQKYLEYRYSVAGKLELIS
jgi:hypothetical protein